MQTPDRKPKVLILYASTGGGHLSAARAIEAAFALRFPEQFTLSIVDVTTAAGSQRIKMLYNSYNLMLKADPRYTKFGLKLLNTVNAEKLMIPVVPKAYRNVRRILLRERPDVIVSVHAIVNHAFIRALKDCGWYGRVPYLIVCTDLTDNFLRGWANPEATRVVAFTEMARQQMIEFGVSHEKISTIKGFPVNPAFFLDQRTKAECRAELGWNPDAFTVLISMGGMAIPRKTKAAVKALLASDLPLELAVVCGMNKSLHRPMQEMAATARVPIHVYGFTQRLPEMMIAADLMITKPGPGTLMEAVIRGLPLLLDSTGEQMPQERGNLEFAVSHGVALKFTSTRQLARLVTQLRDDAEAYQRMQAHMQELKNEEAIFQIAELIAGQVGVEAVTL